MATAEQLLATCDLARAIAERRRKSAAPTSIVTPRFQGVIKYATT